MIYLANALSLLIQFAFGCAVALFVFRLLTEAVRADFYNPICQFLYRATNPVLTPLRRVIPGLFRLDLASLLVAWLLEFVLQILLMLLFGSSPFQFPAVFPILLFYSFVLLLRLSIYVFMGAVIIQAVLSWVSPHHPVMPFFDALTRPFLRPVRRAIPAIGGMDISPLFVLIFFQLLLMLPVAWLEQEAIRMVGQALL